MSRFLTHWLAVTIALAATAWVLPGVNISSWPALLIAALVLGLSTPSSGRCWFC